MSKLDDLIKELCPNGVEYKYLWEVTTWDKKFNGVDNAKQKNTIKYSYYLASDLKSLNAKDGDVKILTTNITNLWAKEDDVRANMMLGEIVCIPWGGNPIVQYYKGKFITGDNRIATSNDTTILNNKYLYYCLQNKILEITSFYRGSGIKHPNMNEVLHIQIPLPPLPVQEEIVRILDTFTELTAELTAELKARKKQYEYYETQLLFKNNFDLIPLSQLCTVNQGLQIPISDRKTEDGKNRYFYITVQFLKGNEDKYYIESPSQSVICDYDDILVTRTGSTGKIITGVKGCFHNNFFKVNCFNTINKRYMFYVLNSKKMFDVLLRTASGGTVPDLPHNKFYRIEIPVPYPDDLEKSLTEQQRIVDILDHFDTLCNDISVGLPAEIKARQQQYEYYRDKLLTFPNIKKEV